MVVFGGVGGVGGVALALALALRGRRDLDDRLLGGAGDHDEKEAVGAGKKSKRRRASRSSEDREKEEKEGEEEEEEAVIVSLSLSSVDQEGAGLISPEGSHSTMMHSIFFLGSIFEKSCFFQFSIQIFLKINYIDRGSLITSHRKS